MPTDYWRECTTAKGTRPSVTTRWPLFQNWIHSNYVVDSVNWNLCPPQARRSDEGVPSYVYTARKMARTETPASHFALVTCLLLRAQGVSRICRSRPTCADVDTDKVHIVIGRYLCASAAVCGGNLLTAAISILSVRGQEVCGLDPHALAIPRGSTNRTHQTTSSGTGKKDARLQRRIK